MGPWVALSEESGFRGERPHVCVHRADAEFGTEKSYLKESRTHRVPIVDCETHTLRKDLVSRSVIEWGPGHFDSRWDDGVLFLLQRHDVGHKYKNVE